jgi:hypothetical protein
MNPFLAIRVPTEIPSRRGGNLETRVRIAGHPRVDSILRLARSRAKSKGADPSALPSNSVRSYLAVAFSVDPTLRPARGLRIADAGWRRDGVEFRVSSFPPAFRLSQHEANREFRSSSY